MTPDTASPGRARAPVATSRGETASPDGPRGVRWPAGWQALIDAVQGGLWLVDGATGTVVAANAGAAALLGVPAPRFVGRPVTEFCASPEDACFWDDVRNGLAAGIDSETFVLRGETAVPVTRRVGRIPPGPGDGPATLWVVSVHDRSEQVSTQRELSLAAADLRATLESTHDGLLVTDLSGRIRNFNRRFANLWGLAHDLLVRGDDDAVFEAMRRTVVDPPGYMRRLAELDDDGQAEATDILHLQGGRIVERIVRPQMACGRPIGRVASFRDVTESVGAQQQVQALAYADALTGLPSRRLFGDRLAQSLALARREGTGFGLLSIDLDRFGAVNARFGRSAADDLLREAARRIATCLRQIDTVARVGSDEFAVLVQQTDGAGAGITASRIVDALALPHGLPGGRSVVIGASIGIALCPSDGSDIDVLLARAATALREAKVSGRACFRFWHTLGPFDA